MENNNVAKIPTRNDVVAAYRELLRFGKHPDDVLTRPEAEEANRLFNEWREKAEEEAEKKGDQDSFARYSLSVNTIYVDAGFTHPDFLKDVRESITLDKGDLPKIKGDRVRDLTRHIAIKARMKIKALLRTEGDYP